MKTKPEIKQLHIAVDYDDFELIQRAAEHDTIEVGPWVRQAAIQKARKLLGVEPNGS